MDITKKLNNFINNINEKDYKISASDSMVKGKVVIELGELPGNLQNKAVKSLKDGNYTIDEFSN